METRWQVNHRSYCKFFKLDSFTFRLVQQRVKFWKVPKLDEDFIFTFFIEQGISDCTKTEQKGDRSTKRKSEVPDWTKREGCYRKEKEQDQLRIMRKLFTHYCEILVYIKISTKIICTQTQMISMIITLSRFRYKSTSIVRKEGTCLGMFFLVGGFLLYFIYVYTLQTFIIYTTSFIFTVFSTLLPPSTTKCMSQQSLPR